MKKHVLIYRNPYGQMNILYGDESGYSVVVCLCGNNLRSGRLDPVGLYVVSTSELLKRTPFKVRVKDMTSGPFATALYRDPI